ncbi:hypothetical protein BCS42_05255 [Crenothrix sp. D3]|nr:hypothetical protein BCS42_05255 [Crenothrix sp. D3]
MPTKYTKKGQCGWVSDSVPQQFDRNTLACFRAFRVFRGLLFCLAFIHPAYARVDAMQLRLLEPYSQDLRWDNIESMPEWVNGVKPEYADDWEMHRVRLAPTQSVTLVLPAYQSLRLYHPKQTLTGKELAVYLSNGTGLAVKQNLQTSTDGHSLVLSPNASAPMLIHVTRPKPFANDFDVALFVSRKLPIAEIAPYRNLIWSTAHWCLLAQEPFALPELYNQLETRQKQRFAVTGPARLALKNRLHYERATSELIQDYHIRYWLDNHNAQELSFSTSVETSRVVTVNTAIEVVGREEQDYIEIPEGQHTLDLESDRPLYIQLLAQTEDDYLFTHLNNPRLPVEDIRKQGLLPTTELKLTEQSAKQLAKDNSHQAGGMIASKLMREAALKRQDYPEGLTEAEQLRGFRSFYRDLLPSKKATIDAQFMAYFLANTLHAVNRPQSDSLLADQHLTDALKRVSNAYFTRVSGAAINEYHLPPQQTDGQLRLIVDKRDCVPRLLHIEIDAKITKDIWLRCEPDREAEDFTRSLAETALIRLQQEANSVNVTLDSLFSVHSQPASLIPTAVYELPLPKDVKTIKLWQADNTKPVNIALQYRAAKPFLLSEQSYLARLRDNSQSLQNEKLPLQRLLQAESRLYKASVAAYPAIKAPTLANKQTLDGEIAHALSEEQKQNWLEALEHWGKVVNFSEGLTRQQAQLAQANVLTKLGESYLAESLRKYLSLNAESRIAEAAATQLSAQYQAQNDNAALLTIAAAMQIHRPSDAHNRLLLSALAKNNEYRFVLLLGLDLENPPLENLLTAAYQLEWWESYSGLQDKLPTKERRFWQGLKAQKQGDTAAALEAWSVAELKPWHDYLQHGVQLHDALTHISEQNAPALYQQWSQWQQQNPSAKAWQNALWHIKDYAGSDSYYALERDVYGQGVRATVERPVVLNLVGPATLNLQIRPLHPPAKPDSALDGWLNITDNNETSRYPFTNNLPAQGLILAGANNLQLGNVINLVYQVGQGQHEIQLNSPEAPLSINVQEQRPEFALGVLPLLQTDTFAEMGVISIQSLTHTNEKR